MTIILMILLLVFLLKKKYDYTIYLFIFFNLVIPKNINFESLIGYFDSNILWDTKLWFIVIMSIVLFIKGRAKLLYFGKLEVLASIAIWFVLISGYYLGHKQGYRYLTSDFRVLIDFILTYFVIQKWIQIFKIDINKILNVFIISGIVYAFITFIIYLFFRGSFLEYIYGSVYGTIWGNRVTFPNSTSQFIFLFISIYMVNVGNKKLLNTVAILLNSISILLAQNRTIIILTILMVSLTLFSLLIYKIITKKLVLLNIGITFLILPILFLVGLYFSGSNLSTNNNLIGEVMGRFSSEGPDSLTYRSLTNNYAIQSVQNPILGDGLGKELMSGGQNIGSYPVNFVDNAFVSLYAKLGICGVVTISSILIYGLYLNLKVYFITREKIFLLLFFLYPCYLINASFMTSQLITDAPVYITFYLLLILPKERLYKRKLSKGDESLLKEHSLSEYILE